jgi:signal peptidase I
MRRQAFTAGALALIHPLVGMLHVGLWRRGLAYCGALPIVAFTTLALTAAKGLPVAPAFTLAIVGIHGTAAFDAYRLTCSRNLPVVKAWYSRWPTLAILAGSLVFVAWGALTHLPRPFRIASASMAPTLIDGDLILVAPVTPAEARELRPGTVILFKDRATNDYFVKRVVAVPGDTVGYVAQNITINGRPLERQPVVEPWTQTKQPRWLDIPRFQERLGDSAHEVLVAYPEEGPAGEATVPANCYFVLGDNRNFSNDSRYLGCIASQDIVGRPLFIWWSATATGVAEIRWNRIVKAIH